MKLSLLLFLALIIGCTSNKTKSEQGLGPEHTVTTESGLQYYYLKKGDGREIEVGSEVSTKLSLMVDDNLVWTSYEAEDSLFTFIAGVSSLISGFNEMAFMMREGDNVVATLPASIAYGEEGAGEDIPPNATLVYDRFEVVSVSEPKKVMADTLLAVYNESGTDAVKETHESITNSEEIEDYHRGMELLQSFFSELRANEQHADLEIMARYFNEKAEEDFPKALTGYYLVLALES
ncbi:MAG: FKBP-type peptidyl-prolyl cis-trans isomerase [Balneolaceae bacterium]|nr:FKBP-type peptidyl-prolyl cis-trans isomerase [Balneolaceae bacterium]